MNYGVKNYNKLSFFKFPDTRNQIEHITANSQVFRKLWKKDFSVETEDVINSVGTLPIALKTRYDTFLDVQKSSSKTGTLLKISQWFVYGKSIIKFYKEGLHNIWKNSKTYNSIKKNYKITNLTDNRGGTLQSKLPKFDRLTFEMSQEIYMDKIENVTMNENTKADIVNISAAENIYSECLFSLNRNEYQLIKRTPMDLKKLPIFGVVFLIFMEMTPFLCYMIPEITPSTCILPQLMPRVWKDKSIGKLKQMTERLSEDQLIDLASSNAYSLSKENAFMLAKSVKLTSKLVPDFLYPTTVIQRRLQNHFNYLRVDNYYLSGLNTTSGANVWLLSEQELIIACLERNIIIDISKETKELEDIKKQHDSRAEQKFYDKLRLRLIQHIIDLDNFNIGYLIVQNSTEGFSKIDTTII